MYSYQVQAFSPAIKAAYAELLSHQADQLAAGKLEWKFEQSPPGPGVAALGLDGERIIGMCSLVATKVRIDGAHYLGYQAMDTVVAPEARGRNVFVNVIRNFYSNHIGEAGVLYGFPNESAARGWFGKLGWARLGAAPFLIRPLRSGYFLRRFSAIPDVPIPYLPNAAGNFRRLSAADLPSMAEAWATFSTDLTCTVERDAEYLEWRVFQHPTATYDVLAGNGGFVIGSLTRKHGGKIGYIMEAVGPRAGLPSLIAALVREHIDAGADAVLAWCPKNAPNYSSYRAAGFFPLPQRFRPIQIYFGARALKENLSSVHVRENWYLSYLDSDTV